jgi:hypothetical protein
MVAIYRPSKPLCSERAQFARLVDGFAAGKREPRQDPLARHWPKRAALRDLDRGGERLRNRELRHDLRARLEAMLDGEMAAIGLPEHAALGDAQERVVGLVVLDVGKAGLVGGDERDALGVGEIDQGGFDGALLGEAMALRLDIEAVAERIEALVASLARAVIAPTRRECKNRASRKRNVMRVSALANEPMDRLP